MREVIASGMERTCKRWGIRVPPEEAARSMRAVPTWGPHADVPAGAGAGGQEFPLVILSNASNNQIQHNVDKLGAPFHAVYTAEMAQAYKPRFQAFEYMLDQLKCDPEDILHVSSSLRYDLISTHDLHFGARAYVARGHDMPNPVVWLHGDQGYRRPAGLVGSVTAARR